MKHLLRFAAVLAFLYIVTPAAFANLQQVRADIPSPVCGPVDPDRGCFYSSGGETTCVARKNLDSCLSRCECQYKNNKEKCKSSPTCINLATSENNACIGACYSDFS